MQRRLFRDTIAPDPLAYWIGMGDDAEFITPSDPRWDIGVIASWVDVDNIAEEQTKTVVEIQSPAKDCCIGKLTGNHEEGIRIHSHINVHKNICNKLGVPSLGYTAFVRLVFRRRKSSEAHQFVFLVTHGAGCAITKGAKLNRLQRLMDSFEADAYAHAHVHDIITDTKPYLTLNANGEIKQREKVGAMTGSFFTTYAQGVPASYGERKNYPPTVLGCPVFKIKPQEDKIWVEG